MKTSHRALATLQNEQIASITLIDSLWVNNWLPFTQREEFRDQFFDEDWNEIANVRLASKLKKLTDDIRMMPISPISCKAKLRDSEIAYLHYKLGDTHWYITGKPSIHAETNTPVFGLTVRNEGRSIMSGPIDLKQVINDNWPAELDLFWFVQSIGNLRSCAIEQRKACTPKKSALRILSYRGRDYPVIHEAAKQFLDEQAIFVCNDNEWLMSDTRLLKQLVLSKVIV